MMEKRSLGLTVVALIDFALAGLFILIPESVPGLYFKVSPDSLKIRGG